MKKGIHFLYGQKNADDTTLREKVSHLAKLGCELIEVPPEPFLEGEYDVVDFVKFARDMGTDIAFCCGLSANSDMVSEDTAVQNAGVKYVHDIISLMEKADMHLMTGTSWTVWPCVRKGIISEEERKQILERTAKVYAKAIAPIVDAGIKSAIEPMNRFENYLINTSAEGVAFCEMVGNPNMGLLLDVFHMSIEERSIRKSIEDAGKRLFHLHLAERNRALPGMGGLDWHELFAALRDVEYSGCLGIESFIVPEGGIAESVGLWRSLAEENSPEHYDYLLKKSLAFLDELAHTYLR